jgi:hypothetical protein
MSLRTTIALVVLAVLAGLAVWWFELRGQGAVDPGKLLLRFEPAQARALELPLLGGGRARVVRGEGPEGGWRLEQPIAFPADASQIDGALENLAKLEHKLEVSSDADPSAFGFPASPEPVRVQTDAPDALELEVGAATPLGSDTYVRRNGRIYAVEEWRTQDLRPSLTQLRDKRVSLLEAEQVERVEVLEDGHRLVTAERRTGEAEQGGWWLVEPQLERGDEDQIRRLLSDLTLARAVEFVDDVKDAKSYGLETPRLELRLRAGERSETIALGRASEKAYARVEGRPVVFEIPQRVIDSVPRELLAYRDKQVLEVDDGQVERVVLAFPREASTYAFRRSEGRFQPEDGAIEVEPEKLDDLLFTLSDLEASAILDQSPDLAALGLAPPRVRIAFEDAKSASLGWLELGEPTADEGLPARSSRGDRIWRVSNELGREVPLGQEAFFHNFAKRKESAPGAAPGSPGPNAPSPPPAP